MNNSVVLPDSPQPTWRHGSARKADAILALCADRARLVATPVDRMVDLFVVWFKSSIPKRSSCNTV